TFDISREQKVAFEVISASGPDGAAHLALEPQLALHEAGGSFLDPRRSKRLLFHEELTQGGMPASRRMTYHFTKPGRYLVSFGNVFAQGGGDFSYLLRIAPAGRADGPEDALSWARRRLHEVRSRAIEAAAAEGALVGEAEPN